MVEDEVWEDFGIAKMVGGLSCEVLEDIVRTLSARDFLVICVLSPDIWNPIIDNKISSTAKITEDLEVIKV
jgi:hypothetical protein